MKLDLIVCHLISSLKINPFQTLGYWYKEFWVGGSNGSLSVGHLAETCRSSFDILNQFDIKFGCHMLLQTVVS
jgi:hypothetical protein